MPRKRVMGFADQINAFVRKTNANADAIVRKVGISIAYSLIMKSPVDTGRFRGNWMLGVGSPDASTDINNFDAEGHSTYSRLQKEILDGVKFGDVFYRTNSLPYAGPLEYGWSQQAPQGMVRLTVVE